MDEEKEQPNENETQTQLNGLMEQLSSTITEAVVRGMEESGLMNKLLEMIEELAQQVDKLKSQAPRQPGSNQTDQPSISPASVLPQIGSLSSSTNPFSLEFKTNTRSSGRSMPRTRNTVRPTIIYRTDPRKSAEPQIRDSTCAEPGCDRLSRARGLCSLHYQRLRYKERKVEHKQTSIQILPPPPPSRRPSITTARRNGSTRGIFALLYDEKGRKLLAGLINQLKTDRSDLIKKLNTQYEGMPGIPLEEEDLNRAIHYHNLTEALRKREREVICRCLSKLRGSLVKTAQKLKMEPDKLRSRINEIELFDDVTRIRNDFKEEVLERLNFNERLDLALTKEKYLEDLGIVREVDTSLRKELADQIALLTTDTSSEVANDAIMAALHLDEARFKRLLRRFDLDSHIGFIEKASVTPGDPS